jgi:hypothetical protein
VDDVNVLAVLVAAAVAVLLSGAYYAAFGTRLARYSPAYAEDTRPAAWTFLIEGLRNLVVAATVTGLVHGLDIDSIVAAVVLALVLWVAFPVVLLLGSVFHERVPSALAAIHAGDWLLKLAAITLIVTLWR